MENQQIIFAMENQQIFDLTCNHDVIIDIIDDFALERCEADFTHALEDSGKGGESEIAHNSPKRGSLLTEFRSLFNVPFLPTRTMDPMTSSFLKTCTPNSLRELV
jgi:hypothetical protein